MLVVHVHVQVKPEDLEAFLVESRRNAAASLEEPGVRRFDLLQDEADTTHVVLNEVYVDQAAPMRTNRRPTTRAGGTRWPG